MVRMTTKRTPIGHPPRDRYTPAALEAFRKMVVLENKCTCTDDGEEPCAVCDQWWAQNSILCNELWLKPWQFPAVEAPGTVSPYDRDSPADVYQLFRGARITGITDIGIADGRDRD